MRAVICRSGGATAYSAASFEYTTQWPAPQLGGLHSTFVDLPCAKASTCLVRVGFSSMNPADTGTDDHRTPKVMGSDIAGTVIAVGPGCTRLKVGDEVFGDIGANATFAGANGHTDTVTTKQLGAWAEVCEALETQLSLKPSNVTQLEAAVLPKVALTSFKALVWYADAKAWSSRPSPPTVLVLGGSSGCGTCAIQIARAFGATVHTTCSKRNIDYCLSLGADGVFDYTRKESWWGAFGPGSFDVVYDCIGEASSGDGAMATLRNGAQRCRTEKERAVSFLTECFCMKGGYFVSIRGVSASQGRARDDVIQASFINSDTNLYSWVRVVHSRPLPPSRHHHCTVPGSYNKPCV